MRNLVSAIVFSMLSSWATRTERRAMMFIRLKDSQALQLWLSDVATNLVLRLALLPKGEEAGHV
jgi:hypothetical protein